MDDLQWRPVSRIEQSEKRPASRKSAVVAFFLLAALALILSRAHDLAPVMVAIGL